VTTSHARQADRPVPKEPDRVVAATARRTSVPRRWLPTGRALVGGALIATAVAAVLISNRSASQPPTTRYVVVTADIAPGDVLRAEQLGTVAAELPADLSVVAAEDAQGLVGRVARVALTSMDLVRPDDLYERGRFTPPASTEVALEMTPAAALIDTIRVGDRVDVLSTDPDGNGTVTIATGVPVSAVADPSDDGIGASGTVRVRLGLPDTATAAAVVDAAVRTEVSFTLPVAGPTEVEATR
jgi:hypothetical protein